MNKHLIIMFALFLVLFSSCENKSTDVKPDAAPKTEETKGSTEAPKSDAGAEAPKADAGTKEAPKEEAKEAEAAEGKEAPKKEESK